MGLVVWLLGPVVACGKAPPLETTAPDAGSETPAQYWLKNADLLDSAAGGVVRRIVGPVRVELHGDGRVQSLPEAKDRFTGFLSREVREKPRRDRGLMLYVQRAGDLTLGRIDGPVLGRVHPGALVSVKVSDGADVELGGLPWGDGVGFVKRDVLGIEPIAAGPGAPGPGRALVLPRRQRLSALRGTALEEVGFVPCYPIRFPEQGVPSQTIDGVELRGTIDADPQGAAPRYHESRIHCAADVATVHGGRLFRVREDGRESEIPTVPGHLRPVRPPATDPVFVALAHSQSVYWLAYEADATRCVEARFENPVRVIRSGLVKVRGQLREVDEPRARHAVTYTRGEFPSVPYEEGDAPVPARLTLDAAGDDSWGFEQEYRPLATDGDAVLMMGLNVAEGAVAFDPAQAERWYLAREACERARDNVQKALAQDPQTMVTAGFHVTIPRADFVAP